MRYPLRPAVCPLCEHTGAIPANTPTTAKLRCAACGARSLVRHCVGDRPCRRREPSPAKKAQQAAAREVVARLGNDPLDDGVGDLWSCG